MNPVCAITCALILLQPCLAAPVVYPGAVTDADELVPFFEAAATRRVDVVGIGDSNQLFGGHGWDDGWILALDDRFDSYATSLLSIGENNGYAANAGSGYRMFSSASSNAFDYDGAPPELEAFLFPANEFSPLDYVYIPSGDTSTITNHGLALQGDTPINRSAALRFSTIYGVSNQAGTNTFLPYVRRSTAPYNTIAQALAPVPLTGTGWSVQRADLDIPADTRFFGLQCMIRAFGQTVTGPFVGYYMRLIEIDRDRGSSFGTLYGNGGKSARDMAATFLELPDQTLTLYFGTLRDDQGADPQILVRINTGLNDRNEDLDPIEVDTAPDDPEAFESHLRLIIDRVRAVWTANAWPEEELYFCLTTSHPIGNLSVLFDDDEELLAYRARAEAIALSLPRCVAVDLLDITDADEMTANSWYTTTTDTNHLQQTAYRVLAQRELAAMQQGRSWYDADANGAIGPEDLYALEAWASPPANAPSDLSAGGLRSAIRFGESAGETASR